MDNKNFWYVTLAFFLILALSIGLSIPLRLAIFANAIVIVIDIIKQARRLYYERREAEN